MQGKYKYGMFITIVLIIVISAIFVFLDRETMDTTLTEQIILESELDDISSELVLLEDSSEGDSIPPEKFHNEIDNAYAFEDQILAGQDLITLFFNLDKDLIITPSDYEIYTTPEVAKALAQAKRIEQQNHRDTIKEVENISYEIKGVSPLTITYSVNGNVTKDEDENNVTTSYLIKFDENNSKITTLEQLNR